MAKSKLPFLNILCAGVVLFLAACTAAPAPTAAPVPSITPAPGDRPAAPTIIPTFAVPTLSFPPTITPLPPATRTPLRPSPSITPSPSPTRDPALTARNWKQWPIIPQVTGRALEIYRRGLALGNNRRAFSKVADCQGIREVLLGVYDLPGAYKLSPGNEKLQETIDWFSGSFNRNGQATLGGFNARAVLLPEFADPAACAAGESPVECEYRLHRPSMVLISLEFGYDGRTTANYEAYLRQVIEFFINKGVLPILSTKADNYEGDQSINYTNAALAVEYDLPLWNWWLAAQDLPNKGLDITRPDGFHISVDAWQVRSATALKTIASILSGVSPILVEQAGAGAGGQAAAPSPTRTPTGQAPTSPPPAPQPANLNLASSGHALVNLAARKGTGYEYLGIYALDPAAAGGPPGSPTSPLQPILGKGWQLQAVAPDGKAILASLGSSLYRFYLDDPGKPADFLTDGFLSPGRQGAAWAPDDTSLLFIGELGGVKAVYLYVPGTPSSILRRLAEGAAPLELYPAPDMERAYFLSGVCTPPAGGLPSPLNCVPDRTWTVPYTSPVLTDLPGVLQPAFSANGISLAYTFRNEKDSTILALTDLNRTRIWTPLPEGYALDYAWAPSGRWLAALLLERSDYSGKPGALRPFLLNPTTLEKVELPLMSGTSPRLAWSADGHYLLAGATDPIIGAPPGSELTRGYRLSLHLFDAQTGKVNDLDGKIETTGMDYVFISRMMFIP